jgi:hypothetical protein
VVESACTAALKCKRYATTLAHLSKLATKQHRVDTRGRGLLLTLALRAAHIAATQGRSNILRKALGKARDEE